ncbi:MAG: hypothetical protein PUE95_08000 [Lachnospiraceae bacterium]|nr:hypothetical protein [Lachnospiraceae bacterium]
MEEYIEKLISQIRCKKARPYIANEIKDHIEEQIDFMFLFMELFYINIEMVESSIF